MENGILFTIKVMESPGKWNGKLVETLLMSNWPQWSTFGIFCVLRFGAPIFSPFFAKTWNFVGLLGNTGPFLVLFFGKNCSLFFLQGPELTSLVTSPHHFLCIEFFVLLEFLLLAILSFTFISIIILPPAPIF